MKHLFSADGRRALEKFCSKPVLYAFDFDGTLAPITPIPSRAVLRRITALRIEALRALAPVAVISGRGLVDLVPRVSKKLRLLAGNHGLERRTGKRRLLLARRVSRCWVEQLSVPIRKFPGVRIEDKYFSLTVHFRNARGGARTEVALTTLCGTLKPTPRLIPGKKVVNLIPAGTPHKGKALVDMMREAGVARAIYVGDEPSDEDVFRLPRNRVFSVRVGKHGDSAAQYFLRNQREIDRLLALFVSIAG